MTSLPSPSSPSLQAASLQTSSALSLQRAATQRIDDAAAARPATPDAPPAPAATSIGSVAERLDSLLSGQVKAGALSGDQAAELKSLFAEAAAPKGETKPDGDTRAGGGLDTLSNRLDRMSALLDRMRGNMAVGAGYTAGGATPPVDNGAVFNGIA